MPFRLGLLAYPLLALGSLAARSGPLGKFQKAGATSPDLARRPRTIGIDRPALLDGHVRSGVLHRLPDGRYYLDLTIMRKRRHRIVAAFVVAGVVMTVLIVAAEFR